MSLYLLTHLWFQFPLPDVLLGDHLPAREDRSQVKSLGSRASPSRHEPVNIQGPLVPVCQT